MPETPIDVEVWCARLDHARRWHAHLLTEAELERCASYRQAPDRARFTLGTALAKLAVSRRLGREPRSVIIDRACDQCGQQHGRPRLPGVGLAMSISHSAERVLVAITPDAPIGVDVEQISRRVDPVRLGCRVLAPGEIAHDRHAFFRYWARKEAVVKATGDGLRMPMTDVVVTPPDRAPRLLRYGQRLDFEASLADLAVGEGYAGALAVLSCRPLHVTVADASELLDSGAA